MSMVLLDTNIVTALFQGDESTLTIISNATFVYMSVVVIGELEAGFRGGNRYNQNLEILERFISRPSVIVLPVSRTTSKYFGLIKHDLKLKGTPIPLNDIWLAAQSKEHNAPLLTYDKHFAQVDDLNLWEFD